MRQTIFLLLLLAMTAGCFAQEFDQTALFNTIPPNVKLSGGIRLPYGKRTLDDFKGRPLVLYFYTTRCIDCLRTFPLVDSLAEEFRGKVAFLLVGRETTAQVRATFSGRPPLQRLTLPVVTGDTALHRIFRHVYVPHVVLLDKTGKVKGITGALSRPLLKALQEGKHITSTEKRDPLGIDPEAPMLFTDWNYGKSWKPIYAATYIGSASQADSYTGGPRRDEQGRLYRWSDLGKLTGIYSRIIPQLRGMNASRVLFDTSVSTGVQEDTQEYAVDIVLRKGWSDSAFYNYARQQLDTYFGIRSEIIRRKVPCWILTLADREKLAVSTSGKWQLNYVHDSLAFTATKWRGFVDMINGTKLLPPVEIVDETGLSNERRYDLTVTTSVEDYDAFRQSLAVYGLELRKEERELPCLLLSSKEKEP